MAGRRSKKVLHTSDMYVPVIIPYTLVNKRMLLIGAYTLISTAGLPALIKSICYSL